MTTRTAGPSAAHLAATATSATIAAPAVPATGATAGRARSALPPAARPPLRPLRTDLAFIADWIARGSRVLDLGCGDGTLLAHLQRERGCTGYGIDRDDAKVAACVRNGVNVIQLDLDHGLGLFGDASFDTVVQLQSLQAMVKVERNLREIGRVGREAIISFPNFGFWQHRVALALGRMPVSESLPYEWYDTPNIRCATIRDFEVLARKTGFEILDCVALDGHGRPVTLLPNLLGTLAVFRLRKAG